MNHFLDINKWNRKETYELFKKYDNPFFNICTDVEITDSLIYSKENKLSFFLVSLFLSNQTANSIESFRYRIRKNKVLILDVIHPGSTILNNDETFSFAYFEFNPNFKIFYDKASSLMNKFKNGYKCFDAGIERDDLIYYSSIPWISFTSFSHASDNKSGISIPKIVFGKYFQKGNKTLMPVSVEVHHALMDGIHVGKFFNDFQFKLNNPSKFLIL